MNQISNGFDFAQLLDPPCPTNRRDTIVSHRRCITITFVVGSWAWHGFCWRKNLGVMEVGISERKSIQKQRWVFVGKLVNSNPPIKSASNWKVSVSLFTKISWSWLRFQPLDSITWLWLKIFCSQWLDDWETWSIKSVVPKICGLTNFDAIGILFITGIYKSTMKFWKTRDANGTGQLSSLVVCRWHLQPPLGRMQG